MEISTRDSGGISIMEIKGRLDTSTLSEFETAVFPRIEDKKELAFDFGGMDYINSSGLRLVLQVAKKLNKNGGKLVVFAMNPNIKEIFDMTGFSKIIPVFEDEVTALKNCG